MILNCPACSARFLVPDTAIPAGGRNVRCGKCAHNWFTNADGTPGKPPAPARTAPDLDKLMREGEVPVTPVASPAAQAKPLPQGSNLPARIRLRPSLKVFFAAGMLTAACLAMVVLVTFPKAYSQAPTKGLALADVTIKRVKEGKETDNYAVAGYVFNDTKTSQPMPHLRLSLLGADGKELQRWWLNRTENVIQPGETMPFAVPEMEVPKVEGARFRLDLGSKLELALRP